MKYYIYYVHKIFNENIKTLILRMVYDNKGPLGHRMRVSLCMNICKIQMLKIRRLEIQKGVKQIGLVYKEFTLVNLII